MTKVRIHALAGTAIALCFVIIPTLAEADDGNNSTVKLDEILVPGKSDDSPASPKTTSFATQYNQVTDEDIKDQGSKDFLNTLRNVPGVMFQSKNMIGSQTGPSLYVRGRGASHPSPDLAIEFDGVPRMGALYGQSLADGIAVPTIGGINVYKSPQPSNFGNGYAMISVLPKYMRDDGREAEVSMSGGAHGTFLQGMSGGVKKDGFDVYGSQNWASTDGDRAHSRAQQQNYYLNAGAALNEHWDLRALGNHVEGQTLAPWADHLGAGVSLPAAERFDTKTNFTTLTLNHHYDQAEGYLKAYYNDTEFNLRNELTNGVRTGKESEQDVNLYGVRGKETVRPWRGGELVLGMDVDKSDLKNTQRTLATGSSNVWDFPDTTLVSPYAALSHMVGEAESFHATPSAGLRYYDHSEFGSKTAPQAGLVLGYGATDLNLSYAKGVNYPSVVVLQGLVQSGNSSLWQSLKPEVVDHYEVGLTHKWGDKAQANATVFEDRGKDRFRAWFYNPGTPVFNDTGDYQIRGMELSGTVSPISGLEFFGGATWLDVEATGTNGVTQDKMPYTPAFTFQAGVNWNFQPASRVTLDMQHLEGLYQGTTMRTSGNYTTLSDADRLGDITVFNLRVSHKLNADLYPVNGAEVFVAVDNLFDEKYEYAKGYPMPGITPMAGFSVKF